jgi:signal transduction histidine kinase
MKMGTLYSSIARELHDEISQNSAILKIKMYMLGKEFPKDKKPVHAGIESLTNVRLHSEAEGVKVRLIEKDGELELTVEDDGIGITEDQILETKSLGIIGMEERVRFLGGELKIKGISGTGTTVKVRIPLQVNNPQQSR